MRYVALLRGINVGGNTMIKMAELKSSFEKLGFRNVVSYINSGNLAFDSGQVAEEKLVSKLEAAIKKDFGLDIQVMVRQQAAIRDAFEHDPFKGQYETHKHMHVLFMKGEMPTDKQALLKAAETEDEKFVIKGREIFALSRNGVADSLLGKGFIEKKLKVQVAGRNWRTVEKLAAL